MLLMLAMINDTLAKAKHGVKVNRGTTGENVPPMPQSSLPHGRVLYQRNMLSWLGEQNLDMDIINTTGVMKYIKL